MEDLNTMKYLIFASQAEAIAAESRITSKMGPPKIGTNAATGKPDPSATPTIRWAIPIELIDGRWAFLSPDDQGVDAAMVEPLIRNLRID